jgi:endonuclease YncB( thermonuclease family)
MWVRRTMPQQGLSGDGDAVTFGAGQRITCREVDRNRYGRSVARCFLPDGREINRLMIESGTAREYRHFIKGLYSR